MRDVSDSYLERDKKEKGRDKERDANAHLNALNKIEIGPKEHVGVSIKESLQKRWERGGGLPMDSPEVRDIRDKFEGANKNNLQRSRGDYLDETNKKKIPKIQFGTTEGPGNGIKENLQRGAAEQLIDEDYRKYFKDGDPSNLNEIIRRKEGEKGIIKHKLQSIRKYPRKGEYGSTVTSSGDDAGDVIVDRKELNLQTDIHEGLHSHSYMAYDKEKGILHSGIKEYSNYNEKEEKFMTKKNAVLNEGITDHFTYKTLEKHDIQPHHESTKKYTQAREVADTIAEKYGEDVLAKAYFNGDIKGLETAVDGNDKVPSVSAI